MKATTYSKFKRLIIEGVEKHLASGGKLTSGTFTAGGACCPISCATGPLVRNEFDDNHFSIMNKKLGDEVDEQDYWNFIDGFDGNDTSRSKTRLYKLGRKLRKEYLNKD